MSKKVENPIYTYILDIRVRVHGLQFIICIKDNAY